MDEFLRVIYRNYSESEELDANATFYNEFIEKLKATLGKSLFDDLEQIFSTCSIYNNEFYFVEGMKLAMAIMEKKYIPKI